MAPPVRWPPERLDGLIAQAQAQGKLVIEPEGKSREHAESLRGALYRRLRLQGITNITLIRQGAVVLMLDNTPPELKLQEPQAEPPAESPG